MCLTGMFYWKYTHYYIYCAYIFCLTQIDAAKRQKLKNPNIFISPTRLCVHNIPLSVDDKQLKKTILKAINDKNAKITEVIYVIKC